jgi:hypothetical protein
VSTTNLSQPLIHVGYHKTGSTWLQQVLFRQEETGFAPVWERSKVNESVVAPSELIFDAALVASSFVDASADSAGPTRISVISNERLSGNPHSGGWDSAILARRLQQLFPSARILIMIREQRSMIRSVYYQYVSEGGALTLDTYLDPPQAGAFRVPMFDFGFFEYHRLIGYYRDLFGSDQILVLPFEMLREAPRELAARVCEFAGACPPRALASEPRNRVLSPLSIALKRRLNFLFVRDRLNPAAIFDLPRTNKSLLRAAAVLDRMLPPALGQPFDRRVAATIESRVGDRYRESNRCTAELTGLDLGRHGYLL